jgi:DNA-binding winged helix-turn-helix (wHTH) protein/Flp pilus assembly protein TadD
VLPNSHIGALFKFDDFDLDCRTCELRKRGRKLRIQQQPFRVLSMLVSAAGDIVPREVLRDHIWGCNTYVDFDRAINKAINHLRQLLDDDAVRPRFIETLPKRGYRFLVPVVHFPPRSQVIRPEIREILLKARHFWNKRTAVDITRSVEYFRRAIENEPVYAPAWAGLAEAYVPPHDSFPAAKAAAEKALMLDAGLAEAHAALGDIYKLYEWNWDAAEREYQVAIALDPNCTVAHQWYAQLLAIEGRHDKAWIEINAARRCEPVSIPVNAFLSYIRFEARQYEQAVTAALEALELDSGAALTHFLLGRAYLKTGQPRKAVTALKTAARLSAGVPLIDANLGYAYARAGFGTSAERIMDRLNRKNTSGISPINSALLRLGLGDIEGALNGLEYAHRARTPTLVTIGDPLFSELAHEPRYQQLLARLGLPNQGH